jgi:hypothetical protein
MTTTYKINILYNIFPEINNIISLMTIFPRIILTQINHPTVMEEKKHQIKKENEANKQKIAQI